MNIRSIILAAGQGTRMRSALPKVLHRLAGKPLLGHVIAAARSLNCTGIHVVYGHGGEAVPAAMDDPNVDWVLQAEQLGTGHAVDQARDSLKAGETVLILYGDVPLIKPETLTRLVEETGSNALALLTVNLDDPTGYGRIVRDPGGKVQAIVEHKDATDAQRAIQEVNTGILAVDGGRMAGWLDRLGNDNAQGEYYLTDVIAFAVADGMTVNTVQPENELEVEGINDRVQLSRLERAFQQQQADAVMREGVTLMDPARFDLRGSLKTGQDVLIDINAVIEGDVTLGDNVHIGANCVIRNTQIGDNVCVQDNCVIEDATIGNGAQVGPFARIRPATRLGDNARIGNFVEVKKSSIGDGSKVNHLSYIGDSIIGRNVNIGAGTITCNYDGANKHQTIIGDNVFVGSDTQLVAPVQVGEGATIGAGTTVTRDVPAGELTLGRARQETRKGWKRPVKLSKD